MHWLYLSPLPLFLAHWESLASCNHWSPVDSRFVLHHAHTHAHHGPRSPHSCGCEAYPMH